MAISLLAYLRLFQGSFIFGEATSSNFFNYFDITVTLSEDLFLHEQLGFLRNSVFLAAVLFSEYLIFRSETSTEQ